MKIINSVLKFITLITIALTLASCTKETPKPDPIKEIACNVAVSVSSGVVPVIAQELGCTNLVAIQASVYDALVKIKVCEKKPQAMGLMSIESVGSGICKTMGSTLLTVVVGAAIPADWQCSNGPSIEKLKLAITKACDKIK